MMRRNSRIQILIVLMLITATTISAQNDNVAILNEENTRLETELQTLTAKQKALSDSIKAQEGQLKSLENDIKKAEKELAKNQDKTDKSKVAELQKRQAQLQLFIDGYILEIHELNKQIVELDRQMEEFNKRRRNLESIRDDVSKNFIETHRDYIEQAFSAMKTNELNAIKADCEKYPTDQKIQEFAKKVETTIGRKRDYDYAAKVVEQPFNRTNVEKALNALNTTGMNSVQTKEFNTVREELLNFEKGLNTFKELINAISKKRGTIFSRRDLDDELDIILNKDNLKGRINSLVQNVPYLKNKYNAYMKALQAEPTKQPAVEKEILGL